MRQSIGLPGCCRITDILLTSVKNVRFDTDNGRFYPDFIKKSHSEGMLEMLGNIQALEAIHSRCSENLPLTEELRDWLAHSIGQYLEHNCDSLNEAFGIVQSHGGVPWWRERAIRTRDAALRALARMSFADLSVYARAKAVAEISERYEVTCWPRDRELEEMPVRYRKTPKEQLWRAFRSGAKMPVSERRLRTLLGD